MKNHTVKVTYSFKGASFKASHHTGRHLYGSAQLSVVLSWREQGIPGPIGGLRFQAHHAGFAEGDDVPFHL